MRIRIKLFARLDSYLPEGTAQGATGNEADLKVAEGTTPAAVFKQLKLPGEVCHLVLVNGVFLPPGERDDYKLSEGDHLAVWPPVAGGGGKKDSARRGPKPTVIEKEMALTHRDFFRTLPRALGTDDYRKSGQKVVLENGERSLEISLGPERERRIAQLAVPVTDVTLTFRGYAKAERDAALRLFERMFQKGGG